MELARHSLRNDSSERQTKILLTCTWLVSCTKIRQRFRSIHTQLIAQKKIKQRVFSSGMYSTFRLSQDQTESLLDMRLTHCLTETWLRLQLCIRILLYIGAAHIHSRDSGENALSQERKLLKLHFPSKVYFLLKIRSISYVLEFKYCWVHWCEFSLAGRNFGAVINAEIIKMVFTVKL